jgi:uncharacterized protein (TIGR03435 family)
MATIVIVRGASLLAVGGMIVAGYAPNMLRGQTPESDSPRPAFEVASIKPNTVENGSSSSGLLPGGVFRVVNGVVFGVIASAFGGDQPLHSSQVIGAPDWVRTSRFDIVAKAPDPDVQERDVLPMLQAMLADRFKLQVHHETRDLPVYALVRARADGRLGPQLRASSLDCAAVARARRDGTPLPSGAPQDRPACGYRMNGDAGGLSMMAAGITMDRLVSILANQSERIVINRTGLAGYFDVDLHWDSPRTGVTNDAPTIFTAAQEQLGLRLESRRAAVDVVVIDHIDRPTED